MILTHRVLGRGLHWLACGVMALLLLVGVALQIATPTGYPPVLLAGAAVALGGSLGWALVDARRDPPGRGGLQALVVTGLALLVLHAVAHFRPDDSALTPSLIPPMIGAGLASGVAFSPRTGAWVALAMGLGVGWVRRDDVAALEAFMLSGTITVTMLLAAYVVHLVRAIATTLQQAVSAAWREQEAVARATQRATEAVRWDGLVHDTVLGSLLAAGRGGSAAQDGAAAALAGEALSAVAAVEQPVQARAERQVRAAADQLGLCLQLDLEGDLGNADRQTALVGAVEQALANVARHSGQLSATVRGRLGPHGGVVTVSDPGRGFDPTRHRGNRMGIDVGIVGRMTAAGGSARVDSAPGAGTTVRLTFGAAQASEAPTFTTWTWSNVLPLALVGLASLGLHLVMAVAHAADVRSVGLLAVQIVSVVAVTAGLLLVPRQRRVALQIMAVVVAVLPMVGAFNLVDPATTSWQYWFTNAMDTAVGTLVLRLGPAWGMPAALAAPAGVATAQLARGGVSWATVVDVSHVLVVVAASAWLLQRTLDLAAAEVHRSSAEVGRLRVLAAQAEEVESTAAARTRDIGSDVWAMLSVVASGTPLTAAQRQTCLALEAATRDGLVAAPLLSPQLRSRLREARTRGIRVDVTAARAGSGVEGFARLLGAVLDQGECRSEIRAGWRPDRGGRLGTITVLRAPGGGPPLGGVTARALADRADLGAAGLALQASFDEDAALLEVRPSSAATADFAPSGADRGVAVQRH